MAPPLCLRDVDVVSSTSTQLYVDKVLSLWLTLSTSRRQGWRRAMNNTTKTTARCARCGRALTSARALRSGYGPRCYTMVRAAAREVAAQHKPHQVAKAVELLEDGGVVATSRAGVYYTVGTEGDE